MHALLLVLWRSAEPFAIKSNNVVRAQVVRALAMSRLMGLFVTVACGGSVSITGHGGSGGAATDGSDGLAGLGGFKDSTVGGGGSVGHCIAITCGLATPPPLCKDASTLITWVQYQAPCGVSCGSSEAITPCGANEHCVKLLDAGASCVADSTNECALGTSTYQAFRQMLLTASDSCKVDSDCAIAIERNACSNSCGVAVNASSEANVASLLTENASIDCSTCPALSQPACSVSHAVCAAGVCALSP